MALAQQSPALPNMHERERIEQFREERRYVIRTPIACYYAILVGLALTPLGIAGLIPPFTQGGLLFHLLRTSIGISCVYLVTGVAALIAGVFRRGRYAHLYVLIMTGVYLLLFSSGNIAFGNAEGAVGGPPDFPWIFENALHAGLMLTGALITGLAALQRGDRATLREFQHRYGIGDPRDEESNGRHGAMRSIKQVFASLKSGRALHTLVARLKRTAVLAAISLVAVSAYTVISVVLHRDDAERAPAHQRTDRRRG